jgi:hypothetical protein
MGFKIKNADIQGEVMVILANCFWSNFDSEQHISC